MKKQRIDEKKRVTALEISKRIEEYERDGKFDIDVLCDPESQVLRADKMTYLNKSPIASLKRSLAFLCAYSYFYLIKARKRLILEEPVGLENLSAIKGGKIITANHFSPYDSFIMQRIFDLSKDKGRLYRIIREGNYTSFSGFYGFLMRNCDTLPLSSDRRCAAKLSQAIKKALDEKNTILIYPEESLWPNYRKPKPMKRGAFDLAVRHGVPIVPVFTVMKNSGMLGPDEKPVLRHIPYIEKPIYPDPSLSKKEASEKMMAENYAVFKTIYEREYGVPLTYESSYAFGV